MCVNQPFQKVPHMQTHTGEKLFSSDVSRSALSESANLKTNIQTHTRKKTFFCEICGSAFSKGSYLYFLNFPLN